MSVWITSDTHFWHTNIIGYCDRPYKSAIEMNEDLIEKWNRKVGRNDTVIHCGDFVFGTHKYDEKAKEILDRLHGYKIIVIGNHDPSKTKLTRIGFNLAVKKLQLDDVQIVHIPPPFNYTHPETKYIYGHVHNHAHAKPSRRCFNACVEVNGYEPIAFGNIKYR